jgi:hypothetical protein
MTQNMPSGNCITGGSVCDMVDNDRKVSKIDLEYEHRNDSSITVLYINACLEGHNSNYSLFQH